MAVPCAQNAATLTLQATICATNVFGSDATEELVGDSNASSHEASAFIRFSIANQLSRLVSKSN